MKISIRYSDHLRAHTQQLSGKRGSDLKLHLMRAAAEALEKSDYRELKVSDLYQEVGVSRATFYLHFSGKEQLLGDLARGLTEFELTLMPSLASEPSAWAGLQKLIDWRIKFLHANLYLTEACAALSDTSISVNEVWYAYSARRRKLFVDELMRFSVVSSLDKDFVNATIDVIGRGLNGLMYSIAGRNSAWSSEQKQVRLDELPAFFSLMIYRALIGCDPDP